MRNDSAADLQRVVHEVDIFSAVGNHDPGSDIVFDRVVRSANLQQTFAVDNQSVEQHLRVIVKVPVEDAVNANPIHGVILNDVERDGRTGRNQNLSIFARNDSGFPDSNIRPLATGNADERRFVARHEIEDRQMFLLLIEIGGVRRVRIGGTVDVFIFMAAFRRRCRCVIVLVVIMVSGRPGGRHFDDCHHGAVVFRRRKQRCRLMIQASMDSVRQSKQLVLAQSGSCRVGHPQEVPLV